MAQPLLSWKSNNY